MRPLIVIACALVVVHPAAARTDGGRQLELRWPVNGTLTSPYGWDAGRAHSGLDIGMLQSLGVRAAEQGVVTRVGTARGFEGYGVVVEVRITDRYSNLYAHLSRPLVRAGDYVTAEQAIGIAGCTGWCTGTHLHFELRDRGRPVDPTPLLSR